MRRRVVIAFYQVSVLIGVLLFSRFTAAQTAQEIACVTEVGAWSSRVKMAKGDFSANVLMRDLALKPNSVGFGSTAWRQDETTVVDGVIYRAHPDKNNNPVVKSEKPAPNDGFVLMQMASPHSWLRYEDPLSAITSFDDLNFEFDDLSESLNCGEDILLPFKIVGHANSVTWRLDTQPKSSKTITHNVDVVLVGIYNRNKRKHYFMSEGYNLHTHVLLVPQKVAGHLETIDLSEGSTLYLPNQSSL